jgi:pimeloyl-ACP methyl ester carboxylesterase
MLLLSMERRRFLIKVILILAIVETLAIAQERSDRMIEVGGYKIHVSEAGTGRVVVFESGLGEDISTWHDVLPKVAQFAHTFTYDRPGIGKSDISPQSKTLQEMTAKLHSLLKANKLHPPYILVGHSLGGLLVQMFAHSYPKEVSGLVLLDPADPHLDEMVHSHMSSSEWAAREKP